MWPAGATLPCGAGLLTAAGPLLTYGAQVYLGLRASVAALRLYSTRSAAVERGLSCSTACGAFQSQGSNLCPRIGRQILIQSTVKKVLGTSFGKDVPSPSTSPDVRKNQTTCLHAHFWTLLCPAACRFSCLTAGLQVSLLKNVYLCSWLCQVCWPAGTFVAVCGISSLTRDPSQAPGLGSAESEPLDPRGSSYRKSSHHFV